MRFINEILSIGRDTGLSAVVKEETIAVVKEDFAIGLAKDLSGEFGLDSDVELYMYTIILGKL